MDALLEFYAPDGPERLGFILEDGSIVEVDNVAQDQRAGFETRPEDLLKYEDQMVATWHTHPGTSSNLSVDDYKGFKNWPKQKHYVIGADGVQCYRVENGDVMK